MGASVPAEIGVTWLEIPRVSSRMRWLAGLIHQLELNSSIHPENRYAVSAFQRHPHKFRGGTGRNSILKELKKEYGGASV
jgi:hypothetical protein